MYFSILFAGLFIYHLLSFIKLWPNLVVCGKFNVLMTNFLKIVNEILLGFHVKTNETKLIVKTKFSANFTRIKLKITKTNPLHFKLLFFLWNSIWSKRQNFNTIKSNILKIRYATKKGFLHMLSLKNSSFIQSVKCLDIMLLCIVFVQSKICFRGEDEWRSSVLLSVVCVYTNW